MSKSTRIDETISITLNISQEHKQNLEKAAAVTGLTLNDYIIHQALIAAMEHVVFYDKIVRSETEKDLFMAALKNPHESLKEVIKEN